MMDKAKFTADKPSYSKLVLSVIFLINEGYFVYDHFSSREHFLLAGIAFLISSVIYLIDFLSFKHSPVVIVAQEGVALHSGKITPWEKVTHIYIDKSKEVVFTKKRRYPANCESKKLQG